MSAGMRLKSRLPAPRNMSAGQYFVHAGMLNAILKQSRLKE